MHENEKEMLNELIIESREHLENIEPDLLELERNGMDVSDDLINRVFRAVHSIKGGFGFFNIDPIIKLSHVMENVMSRIRDKQMDVTSDVTDALLHGIDKLQVMLDDVAGADAISYDAEYLRLEQFYSPEHRENDNSSTEVSSTTEIIPDEIRQLHQSLSGKDLENSVREGKYIYQIIINEVRDVIEKKLNMDELFTEWGKYGDILDTNPKLEKILLKKDILKSDISILLASVLEADLIGTAIDVSQEKILQIDISSIKKHLHKEDKKSSKTEVKDKSLKQKTIKVQELRIEDALRVKITLLNNLMTNAGELVLVRNQFIQTIGRPFREYIEVEKKISNLKNSIKAVLTKSTNDISINDKVVDKEIKNIDRIVDEAFNFRISDMQIFNGIAHSLDTVTTVLQESIMQTRMQPISVLFSKFPRVIRDLSKKLNKKIELTQIGQEVELDKSIIELLSDPLTHLIRNCADHGVEMPDDRIAVGKAPQGEIVLKAYQDSGKVIIEINDDGAGIDPKQIKAKAIETSLITPDVAEKMTDIDAQWLIFTAGLSSSKNVSEISGRGVGMDVVRANVERLGGIIELESIVGKGTKISLKLPLTLAIIPSLVVASEGRRFAVPLVGLDEVVRIRSIDVTRRIERIHNSEVVRLREKLLPLVRLSDVLGLEATVLNPITKERVIDKRERWSDRRGKLDSETGRPDASADINEKRTGKIDRRKSTCNAVKILVLRIDRIQYGLIVDDVFDSEEIVVKPLPDYFKSSVCYAGVTIMGDGSLAMILDTNGVAEMAHLEFNAIEDDVKNENDRVEKERLENSENMLLFSIGDSQHFAISLSEVARIEKRGVAEIEVVGGKEFVNHDGSMLRLIRIENHMNLTGNNDDQADFFVIVPKNTTTPIGFMAFQIEDTVCVELNLNTTQITGVGIKGSTIINKKLTIVLDVLQLMESVGN